MKIWGRESEVNLAGRRKEGGITQEGAQDAVLAKPKGKSKKSWWAGEKIEKNARRKARVLSRVPVSLGVALRAPPPSVAATWTQWGWERGRRWRWG